MGTLTYDRVRIQFEDRTLAHLQIVMIQKLRRGESFLLSWCNTAESGGGRSSTWISPAAPIYFEFSGGPYSINQVWLAQLTLSANSIHGLVTIGEHKSSTPPTDQATTRESGAGQSPVNPWSHS
ncbi:DUF7882 family protein [Cryobacterium sp. MP_M5]|uniref:DUF7882 family protein n=1 Tax=Cryobacterium sp. MP_M5 TaxID=3071715 RepID=UPI003FA3A2AB